MLRFEPYKGLIKKIGHRWEQTVASMVDAGDPSSNFFFVILIVEMWFERCHVIVLAYFCSLNMAVIILSPTRIVDCTFQP